MSIENIKQIARDLQEVIQKYDDKASYNSCMHAISRYYGFENWNTANAYCITNNIEVIHHKYMRKKGVLNNE
jgi:hypothetical protein